MDDIQLMQLLHTKAHLVKAELSHFLRYEAERATLLPYFFPLVEYLSDEVQVAHILESVEQAHSWHLLIAVSLLNLVECVLLHYNVCLFP